MFYISALCTGADCMHWGGAITYTKPTPHFLYKIQGDNMCLSDVLLATRERK